MRRTIRCDHGFMEGLCREPGCKHEEKRPQTRLAETIHNPEEKPQRWRQRPRAREAKRARKLFLLTALVIGCGGVDVPRIPTPGTCGFWEELRSVTAEPGECSWVFSNIPDVVFRPVGDCPSDGDPTCAILLPGEELVAWGELSRPESAALEVSFDLLDDGSCPVSCLAEYGCEPDEEEPSICVPCTAAEPCH